MPAKTLTPEQKGDAARLRGLFKAWQDTQRVITGSRPSQSEIADRLGFGQSALSQYLTGRIPLNEEVVIALAGILGTAPAQISPSIAAAISRKAEAATRATPAPVSPVKSDRPPLGGVDREMIHANPMLTLPRVSWESVRMRESGLPDAFELVVADESMAPELKPGNVVMFLKDIEPLAGKPVLVRDKAGGVHIRNFKPRRPGVWIAEARNADFADLTSDEDGLEILAVAIGSRWR